MIRVKSKSAPDLVFFATTEHSRSSYGLPVVITQNAQAVRPMDEFMHSGSAVNLGILSIDEPMSWYNKIFWLDKLHRAGYTVKQIQKP
jgi:hypothetical protein